MNSNHLPPGRQGVRPSGTERDRSAATFAATRWGSRSRDYGLRLTGIENAGTATAAQTEQNRQYWPNTCSIDAYIYGP